MISARCRRCSQPCSRWYFAASSPLTRRIVGYVYFALGARSLVATLVGLPALWALADWVRGWLFTGFPWLALGYSQVPASPLAGYAPVLGVYGVTFATVLTAGSLVVVGFACRN